MVQNGGGRWRHGSRNYSRSCSRRGQHGECRLHFVSPRLWPSYGPPDACCASNRSPPAAHINKRGEKEVTMALDIQMERQQAHALLDQLPPAKLEAVRSLLEVMVDDDGEEDLTEEDRRTLRASEDYFRNGGQGIPFEQVVASLGFTMEQIRAGSKGD